jgi:uncharacterized PurR-regulated membrane protein YhhQ (DUF165 family)
MKAFSDFFADLIYLLESLCVPLVIAAIGIVVFLSSPKGRVFLQDRASSSLFWGMSAVWAALIPWALIWATRLHSRQANPSWANWPIFASLISWLILAYLFINSSSEAVRGRAWLHVFCNAPALLWASMMTGFAISGGGI